MKNNDARKILGTVLCLFLSLFFVISLIIIPFYYSVIALTIPETIANVIQNVDYKTVIEQSPDIKSSLQDYGINSVEADKYMKSSQTKELIEIYADEVTEIFLNIPDDRLIDVSFIRKIVDDNIDDFLTITEDNTKLKFSKEQITNDVDAFFKKNEFKIENAVPVIEETRTIVKTIMASTLIKRNLTFTSALIIIGGSGIIIAIICLIKRSKGFLWIGIDFTLISIILLLIVFFSHSYFINKVALKVSKFETEIIKSAISICTDKIIFAIYGMVILAILFIMFYIVIILVKRKYKILSSNNSNYNATEKLEDSDTADQNTEDGSMCVDLTENQGHLSL